jgi:low affinity Fe/Cu permease
MVSKVNKSIKDSSSVIRDASLDKVNDIERISIKVTKWIGTPWSIIVHTILFIGIFSLRFFGFRVEDILLILTTAVSLEAIYLAIFIQMTVNRTTVTLEEAREDIEDIQEDVEDLEENVEDISEDVEDISEDIEEIHKKKILKKVKKKSKK